MRRARLQFLETLARLRQCPFAPLQLRGPLFEHADPGVPGSGLTGVSGLTGGSLAAQVGERLTRLGQGLEVGVEPGTDLVGEHVDVLEGPVPHLAVGMGVAHQGP